MERLSSEAGEEDVIEVPTISCSPCPSRSPIPEPQSAEQLVKVPTVLSPTRIAVQIAEQIADTPVPHGRGGKRRYQGFLPEQSSTATSSSLERITERTVEQIVDIPSYSSGLAHGSSSSAGPADEDFTGGFSHFSPWKKVLSAGQVVSARLGGHVSSSTLSAHQMARAGEPADSDGSIEWVMLHVGETDKTFYWNRRSGATSWCAPPGVEVLWMGGKRYRGMLWYFNQVTGRTAHAPSAASWLTGYGVRGLASPHPFLGATRFAVRIVLRLWTSLLFCSSSSCIPTRTWRCLSFRSSIECSNFQLCFRGVYAQCKLCKSRRFHRAVL